MDVTTAVIFPDTLPSERMLSPLVQVFAKLVYFQPVENDPVPGGMRTPFIDALVASGRCCQQAPVPLGESCERFLHLVADIRDRRNDYAVQFAQTSLASVPALTRPGRESKSSLISDLLTRQGLEEKESDRKTELLWQGRLVLKLAEIFDTEQETLRRELQKLQDREENLLEELRKEEADHFSFTGKPGAVSPVTSEMALMRLKAWARLFVESRPEMPDSQILLTDSADGMEMVAEAFAKMSDRDPRIPGSLILPAQSSGRENMEQKMELFRTEAKGLLAEFSRGLRGQDTGTITRIEAPWEKLTSTFFPEKSYARTRLQLYCFSGVTAKRLFAEAFLHEFSPSRTGVEQSSRTGVLMGRLERI